MWPHNAGGFWTLGGQIGMPRSHRKRFAAAGMAVLPCRFPKEPTQNAVAHSSLGLRTARNDARALPNPPYRAGTSADRFLRDHRTILQLWDGKGGSHAPVSGADPAGCVTAHFPGTKKPWTTVSKAGRTFCKFEEKPRTGRPALPGNVPGAIPLSAPGSLW